MDNDNYNLYSLTHNGTWQKNKKLILVIGAIVIILITIWIIVSNIETNIPSDIEEPNTESSVDIEDEEALYENLENLMSESQISDTAIIINECIEENPDIISSSLTYERSYIFDGELIYFIMTDSEGNEYEVIPVPDSEQLTNDSKLTVKLRTRKDGEAKVFCEKKQTSL